MNIFRFLAAVLGGMLLYLASVLTVGVFMDNLSLDRTLTQDDREQITGWCFASVGLAFGAFWFAFGRR